MCGSEGNINRDAAGRIPANWLRETAVSPLGLERSRAWQHPQIAAGCKKTGAGPALSQ